MDHETARVLEYGLDWPAYTIQLSYSPVDKMVLISILEVGEEGMDFRESLTGMRPTGLI